MGLELFILKDRESLNKSLHFIVSIRKKKINNITIKEIKIKIYIKHSQFVVNYDEFTLMSIPTTVD